MLIGYRTSAYGAGQTHSAAVKGCCRFLHWLSRNECSYASFKACAMSAIRSDGCSMPIDSRIVESRTPIFWRMSAGTPEWVMLAGRLASDSVPPRLTASLMICSAFKNLKAAAWPPTMSNENVEPAPVHCLANRRPGGGALFVVSKVMDLRYFGVLAQVIRHEPRVSVGFFHTDAQCFERPADHPAGMGPRDDHRP